MAKRNMNPNSLKNLEKGKEYQFKSGDKLAKEINRKGGINSQKVQRSKTDLRELLEIYLSLPNEETGEQNNIAITAAIIKKALSGDVKAYETIRDTIGQKPVERQEIIGGDLTIEVYNDND